MPSMSSEPNRKLSYSTSGDSHRPLLNRHGQTQRDIESCSVEFLDGIGTWSSGTITPTTISELASITAPLRTFGATSQATLDSIFGESSGATFPRNLDTARIPTFTSSDRLNPLYFEGDLGLLPREEMAMAQVRFPGGTEFARISNADPNEGLFENIRDRGSKSDYPGDIGRPPDSGNSSMATSQTRIDEVPNENSSALSGSSKRADTAQETLNCSACDALFTGKYRRGNQLRHMRMKHGTQSKSYRCTECSKEFARQDALLKHTRKYHPELRSAEPIIRKTSISRLRKPTDGRGILLAGEMDLGDDNLPDTF